MQRKKIAILNLPIDNNFGGHLQRYALMEVLRAEGADVTHLNCRYLNSNKSLYKRIRCVLKESLRFGRALLKGERNIHDLPYLRYLLCRDSKTERFYDRYVKHTERIYTKEQLATYNRYDAYVVGSDQVWRAPMANYNYGIDTYFFDYLPECKPRYAYGVSLGTKDKEYTDEDIMRLAPLYKQFKGVTVREDAALKMFEEYGWTKPEAESVLDPTMLLDRVHYEKLVENAYTKPSAGKLFCYILDEDEGKKKKIEQIINNKGLRPYCISLQTDSTVEQWIRSFMDAEYVITDSYHGFVFSLIFNKPFYLMYNEKRGNVRFESLLHLVGITGNEESYDWEAINVKICQYKEISLNYIKKITQSL